jgi:alpha-galactosidase/6-phospho-beta-glucosidase family protein
VQIRDLSEELAAVINRRLASTRLTVSAALTGDRERWVEALLLDGAVSDRDAARALVSELAEAHKPYLPNFFPAA